MKKLLIYSILCLFVLSGCKKVDDSIALKDETKRTVLMYLFQDSNLWEALTQNINEIEQGWVDGTDGTMLIYVDASTHITQFGGKPVLLEIKHDTSPLIVSKIVKVYEDKDPSNADVFSQVQKDAIAMYPAQSYGLIISGHGNGFYVNPETKSVTGADRWGAKGLDIDVIAKNLAVHYQFLIFDACLMGEAATLYQLRKGVDFVMASVELSPGDGFAYTTGLPALYTQPYADIHKFAQLTAHYYQTGSGKDFLDKQNAYLNLCVYRMSEAEKVAAVTKKAIETLNLQYNELSNTIIDMIADPARKTQSSMYYPFILNSKTAWFYDMGLLVELLLTKGHKDLAIELHIALNKFVMQKYFYFSPGFAAANPEYRTYTRNLSFYLPHQVGQKDHNDDAFYNRFEWSAASGFTTKWETVK